MLEHVQVHTIHEACFLSAAAGEVPAQTTHWLVCVEDDKNDGNE